MTNSVPGVTITGPGASLLTIDASDAHTSSTFARVFTVQAGAAATISGLTISGGRRFVGGGILNDGILTLDHVVVTNNESTWAGGGIESHSGASLTIKDSTITGNISGYHAAGLNLIASTATDAANVVIQSSTISHNVASVANGGRGGGVSLWSAGGQLTVTMTNTTVSGNSAFAGGGLNVEAGNVALTIVQGTIADNRAEGTGSTAGGVYAVGAPTLKNTIVADNFNGDIVGAISSNSEGNLFGATVAAATGLGIKLGVGETALLTPLGDHLPV